MPFIQILKKKVNLRAHLFLFILIWLLPFGVKAQVRQIFAYWKNLQPDSVSQALEVHKEALSDEQFWLLKTLNNSSHCLIDFNDDSFHNFIEQEAELQDYQTSNALQAFAKWQRALLHLNRGEEWNAAWQLLQSYKLSKKAWESDSANTFTQMVYGLHLVTFGVIPDKYSLILKLTGTNGDVSLGLRYMKEVMISGDAICQTLSRYLVMFTKVYLLEESMGAEPFDNWGHSFVDYFVAAQCLSKQHMGESALYKMQMAYTYIHEKNDFPGFHYSLGELYLWKGDYTRAILEYDRFLKLRNTGNFVKDIYFKISLCYWLKGNIEMYAKYLHLAQKNGSVETEVDKNASYYLQMAEWPHRKLFMARFAYDGGYYTTALQQIDEIDLSALNEVEKTEYWYRKARILQAKQYTNEALEAFDTCILQQPKDANLYFAPNAWLQKGYIYFQRNQKEEARTCFEKVPTYTGHPYSYSLKHKAEIALKNME